MSGKPSTPCSGPSPPPNSDGGSGPANVLPAPARVQRVDQRLLARYLPPRRLRPETPTLPKSQPLSRVRPPGQEKPTHLRHQQNQKNDPQIIRLLPPHLQFPLRPIIILKVPLPLPQNLKATTKLLLHSKTLQRQPGQRYISDQAT